MISTVEPQPETSTAPVWAPQGPRLRSWINELGVRVVAEISAGLRRLSRTRVCDPVGILTYHRIASRVPGLPGPLYNVPPKQFRKQLTGLLARGFEVWPLRKVLDHRAAGTPVPAQVLVVTFDDGFETVHGNAWPVLRELRIPATVFLNTAYVDTDAPFPFDAWGVAYHDRAPSETYRPLSWAQCHEMADDGLVEFAAHTHTHQDFRNRPEAFARDLEMSVDIVRRRFSQQDVMFAFPYGSSKSGFAGGELAAVAKRTGVICALTTDAETVDPESDPFDWGRFHVFSWDRPATLAAKVEGWYRWAPRLRQAVSQALRGARPRQPQSTDSTARIHCTDPLHGDLSMNENNPTVSIVVPTYNRADMLEDALDSLVRQQTSGRLSYEIVVVDNASSDATGEVVRRVAEASEVPVRYVYEETPGDAPARNRGIQEARGGWVAFFDDDQFAEADWVMKLHEAALQTGAPIVGGPVHLDLSEEQLEELSPICRETLREIRFYDEIHPYVGKQLPGCGNALVARTVFDAVGSFDVSMVNGGSDSDFFLKAQAAGHEMIYTPQAVIRHRVPEQRLSPEYFKWDALQGHENIARIDHKSKGTVSLLLICTARLGQALLVNGPLWLWARVRGDGRDMQARLIRLWRAEAYIRRTLSLLAPRLFPQKAFLESLNFRAGIEKK